MDSVTQILEILIATLIMIEIVELYFNMRALKTHERELDEHLAKLEQHTKRIEMLTTELDKHMETLEKLLRENESSQT